MEREAEGERREHHVGQAEIQNGQGIPLTPPGVGEQQQGCEHAQGGDRVRTSQAKPLLVAVRHGPRGEMSKRRADGPQPAPHEGHDPQPARRISEQIGGQGSPATAWRRLRRAAGNRSDQVPVCHQPFQADHSRSARSFLSSRDDDKARRWSELTS